MKDKEICLALQGGGAHGAFTWGVLERLLQEPWLQIAAVSGTSAGALNAAALKVGLAGGKPANLGSRGAGATSRKRSTPRANARAILADLWQSLPNQPESPFGAWQTAAPPAVARLWEAFTPAAMLEQVSHMLSPYDNALYQNPLAPLLARLDAEALRSPKGPALFIGATNLRSGKIRVFSGQEVTPETILASACLPQIFRAVELDDPQTGQREAFWDGGFSGNPPLFPLYASAFPRDIVIVHLNPLRRDSLPTTPVEIEDRVNEISFNASLLSELRAIHFVNRLSAEGRLEGRAMKDVLVHLLGDDALMASLSGASKLLPDADTIAMLKAAGEAAAERFLQGDAANLGLRASADLTALTS